jgi:hypothetical protein
MKADQGDAVQQALRPYATVGVAIVAAASLVAVTPLASPLPNVQTRDVMLVDTDLTPWIDQFNTASTDATTLLNNFYDAPYIGLQQAIANESGFLQAFFESPTSSTVTDVMSQMQDNLAAVLTGYGLQDATVSTTKTVLDHTLDAFGFSGHSTLFGEIPGYLPASDAAEITPIINFLGSPASGIIMGDLGPFISPLVALSNSIGAGDDLNTTLADMYGAFFNGADLSLNSLLPAINGLDLFPPGMEMTNLDIGFGGLLSTGSVGTAALGDGGVGGSIFNSVGLYFSGVPVIGTLNAPSQAIGPIGALEGWAQTIASLLGWDGSGSPLADVTLPVIPTDVFDGSTIPAAAAADILDPGAAGSVAADLSTLWQDLVTAF